MSPLDRDLLAERAIALERHLRRVAERLPVDADDLHHETDASDAVVLHLSQATQIAIDLATAACVKFELGAPGSYADAFAQLRETEVIDPELARRLVKAAGSSTSSRTPASAWTCDASTTPPSAGQATSGRSWPPSATVCPRKVGLPARAAGPASQWLGVSRWSRATVQAARICEVTLPGGPREVAGIQKRETATC